MKHIFLFESYINKIYEISYTEHWKERTSPDNPFSRVVPYNNNFKYGFKVSSFKDQKGTDYSIERVERILGSSGSEILEYLSFALNYLTNSRRLSEWLPENNKQFQMLDLGKICFYTKKNIEKSSDNTENLDIEYKFYPIIKGGKGPDSQDFYREGDTIWGMIKDVSSGVTVKYYNSDEKGLEDMYKSFMQDTKSSIKDFYDKSAFGYPYGKNFEVIIDFTDTSKIKIKNKIKDQIEGKEWKLGPEPEKEIKLRPIDYLSPEFKRIQISEGLIMSIIKEEGEKKIYEATGDVTNFDQIYKTYQDDKENKTNDLKSTPVLFKAYEVTPIVRWIGPNEYTTFTRKSSIPKIVELNPGDRVYINKTPKGTSMDPKKVYEFRFVTSEPSIFKRGSVQLALDIIEENSETSQK